MIHRGGCHCGALSITFETRIDPGAIAVRACQCSFCRKHNTRSASDPDGALTVAARSPGDATPYMFGLRTARYILCRHCGVYVAAVTLSTPHRGLAIVNALDDHALFTSPPQPSVYDAETLDDRIARRQARWTPTTLEGL